MRAKNTGWWSRALGRMALLLAVVIGTGNGGVAAQAVLDLCGCRDTPGLLPFNANDSATFPPGTVASGVDVTIPLPPDGVLRFSSFSANDRNIHFARNAANTPVTLLVSGDVLLTRPAGCCRFIWVGGDDGSSGGNGFAGVGGLGGPGGFRGGDGAAAGVNLFTVGGAGQGPGGGVGATPTVTSVGGTFFGVPELLPLVGGSGGGGGASLNANTGAACTGGGGGGGGGAILIAANGTITIHNYDLYVNGGTGGSVGNGSCARGGAGGSAGAMRLVASRFVHVGTARLFANGAGSHFNGGGGTSGRIRLETVDSSAQTQFSPEPTSAALRITGPGPLSNPVAPSVRITHVNGNAVPEPPQGFRGAIDIVLPAPGVVSVDLATTGVPSGTLVEVKIKPRVGDNPLTATVPLEAGSCDAQGACTAIATFNVNAGAHVVEARATFQVQ
jgi:hypothetical protein